MDLLQAAHEHASNSINGMEDVSFTLKDVIYICGFLVTIVGGWFKVQANQSESKAQIESLEKHSMDLLLKLKEHEINSKNGRKSIRKEYTEADEKNLEISNKRIDIVKKDLRDHQQSVKEEFRLINEKLANVQSDTSTIKGNLDTLITLMNNKKS